MLKTLKDIEMCNPPRPHSKTLLKEIKEEAIKWVKEEKTIKADEIEGKYNIWTETERWMKRLNITSEDFR
jgi:hypothetical protein